MTKTTRSRLTEVRVRTATADDAKHGRQLFDGLGPNGLYLHVTPAGAKCWVQQLMVPNAATGKSRRVRIGLGAWPRVTLALARTATFANRCLRDEGCDPLAGQFRASLERYAGALGPIQVSRISAHSAESVLLRGRFVVSTSRSLISVAFSWTLLPVSPLPPGVRPMGISRDRRG